jgi:hypothetical protein
MHIQFFSVPDSLLKHLALNEPTVSDMPERPKQPAKSETFNTLFFQVCSLHAGLVKNRRF